MEYTYVYAMFFSEFFDIENMFLSNMFIRTYEPNWISTLTIS
jgi:hypothetical protein